jgi:tRNA uridine 5-carbamoylmethylation protein Kti12
VIFFLDSVGYAQIYFPANLTCATQRNRQRACQVPDEVIVSMATRIDVPSCTNAWERLTVVWTDEDHEHPNL